jgi:5-methylcytosine-specific restriction endonuclease McrA
MNDTDFLVRKYAIDLVGEATGGDAYYMEKLVDHEEITRDDVLEMLRKARVPLAMQLVSDVDQIFGGEEPRYFIRHDRVVERYREHHNAAVSFSEPDHGLRPLFSEDVVRELEQEMSEHEQYGVSLKPYRRGAACVTEQTFFYETDEWKDRATVVRIMDCFTCRNCGRKGRDEKLHIHHDEHIYSIFSHKFHHNFDVVRLRCLCEACHSAFHSSHVRGYSYFKSAEREQVDRGRRQRRALERLHDALRECRFCFSENRRAA